jgi:hypothetical protein
MALTRDKFLATKDSTPPLIAVDCPEFGDVVYLRTPTAAQVDQLSKKQALKAKVEKEGSVVGFRARCAILLCANEDGTPMFTDVDEQALATHPNSQAFLDRIYKSGKHLLGFDDADVETEAKNLQATQGDDSSID